MNMDKVRERNDPAIHLGVLEGENKQRMCSEWRWEVMCDGGRMQARKEKDSQHDFICLGVG